MRYFSSVNATACHSLIRSHSVLLQVNTGSGNGLVIKQQTVTEDNLDPDPRRHMASLALIELKCWQILSDILNYITRNLLGTDVTS